MHCAGTCSLMSPTSLISWHERERENQEAAVVVTSDMGSWFVVPKQASITASLYWLADLDLFGNYKPRSLVRYHRKPSLSTASWVTSPLTSGKAVRLNVPPHCLLTMNHKQIWLLVGTLTWLSCLEAIFTCPRWVVIFLLTYTIFITRFAHIFFWP